MKHFTCDACHYIFQSDAIPLSCPVCNTSSVIAQNSTSRKFKIPAVRISTETEISQSKIAETEESARKSFLDRVKSLPGYTLTDDEYHTALMLLFYFKSAPEKFTSAHLECLLNRGNPSTEDKMGEASARDLYTKAQKHFVSQLGRKPAAITLQKLPPIQKKNPLQACSSSSVRRNGTRSSAKSQISRTSAA